MSKCYELLFKAPSFSCLAVTNPTKPAFPYTSYIKKGSSASLELCNAIPIIQLVEKLRTKGTFLAVAYILHPHLSYLCMDKRTD